MPKRMGMAIAWMREEDWPRWRAIEFVEWCRVNGRQVDSKGRSAFAVERLAVRHGHGSTRH